ncbi:Valyl/Leucyl/Isoleucyl-tRNA synthetase, class I, anticodon-binding domain protein, partial [mine drainage metagenome]
CAEFILDEDGKKMSKSKGNGILAMELLDKFGADATRLFFYSTAAWKPKPLVEKVVKELETKILGTLLNMYSFFSSNANLDGYQHHGLLKSNNLLDKWLLSRINTTVANVTKAMDSYEFHDAQRLISDLIEQTSNVYLRLSRRRFWDPSDSIEEKNAAYSVLFHALEVICRLLAPIAPFTTEFVYRNLMGGNESVH